MLGTRCPNNTSRVHELEGQSAGWAPSVIHGASVRVLSLRCSHCGGEIEIRSSVEGAAVPRKIRPDSPPDLETA